MSHYPVELDATSPLHFDRIQLLLRILIGIVLAWIGVTAGWLVCLLYGTLPIIAAVAISSIGSERYLSDFAPRLWRVLAWLLQLSAFMTMVVDRFPAGTDGDVRATVHVAGRPTIATALLRLVTSIPSGFVLCILWFVSSVLWVIGAFFVLFGERMPRSILAFQLGVLSWQARLVAYHASLVEEYPPFSFGTHRGRHQPVHAAVP